MLKNTYNKCLNKKCVKKKKKKKKKMCVFKEILIKKNFFPTKYTKKKNTINFKSSAGIK